MSYFISILGKPFSETSYPDDRGGVFLEEATPSRMKAISQRNFVLIRSDAFFLGDKFGG